jgi:hypothetical protein
MIESLKELFLLHKGKVSDKWSLYLDEMDQLFAPYRDMQVRLLEIGVQNGGSLEVWNKYFLQAEKIVGCDVDKKCGDLSFDDDRVVVVVGDANTDGCEREILQQESAFDIIIDDGSHKSGDIIRSFARYFPHLVEGGVYMAEDLHASYWDDYQGGLHNPLSAMAFYKRLADVVNFEHWRNNSTRSSLLARFAEEFNIKFSDLELAKIHSIEFANSICIIRNPSQRKMSLGDGLLLEQMQ